MGDTENLWSDGHAPFEDAYILAHIVLLVDELFHFQTELLVDSLQLFLLIMDVLHTEHKQAH